MRNFTSRRFASLSSSRRSSHVLVAAIALAGCSSASGDGLGELTIEDDEGIEAAADDLVSPLPTVAQVAGFDLSIAQAGADIDLAWTDQGGGFVYDVWRSTDPYFFPGDAGSVLLSDDLATASFTDVGGNDATSYYYRIETDGADEYLSTIAGKFVQPLVADGFTILGFPLLDTASLDAASLAAEIPGVIEVKRWFPYQVFYAPGHPDPAWAAPNFSWNAGDAVAVRTDASAGATYTQTGTVPVATDIARTLATGQNLATVPLSMSAADAQGLAAREPSITQLDQWNLGAQDTEQFFAPNWGTNFAVEPGQALWVYVDEPTAWPLRTPYFSEYVEGTFFNKAVEIYNPTAVDFDLDECSVQIYRGGNPAVGNTIALSGSIEPGGVAVLCDDNSDDTTPCDIVNGQNFWNGDDTVVLRCEGVALDVIGQIGFDPGAQWNEGGVSTLNSGMRRDCSVQTGDPEGTDAFDPSAQWSAFGIDDYSGLGEHTCP